MLINELYQACIQGDAEKVTALINHPFLNEVNYRYENGKTPLYIACENGHDAVVNALLQHKRIDVDEGLKENASIGRREVTPFQIACVNGHLSVVQRLLADNRSDVNLKFKFKDEYIPPLFAAFRKGHIDVVYALLDELRINVEDSHGESLLFEAWCAGNYALVDRLLAHPKVDVWKEVQVDNKALNQIFTQLATHHASKSIQEQQIIEFVTHILAHATVKWHHCYLTNFPATQIQLPNWKKATRDEQTAEGTRLANEHLPALFDYPPFKVRMVDDLINRVLSEELSAVPSASPSQTHEVSRGFAQGL